MESLFIAMLVGSILLLTCPFIEVRAPIWCAIGGMIGTFISATALHTIEVGTTDHIIPASVLFALYLICGLLTYAYGLVRKRKIRYDQMMNDYKAIDAFKFSYGETSFNSEMHESFVEWYNDGYWAGESGLKIILWPLVWSIFLFRKVQEKWATFG